MVGWLFLWVIIMLCVLVFRMFGVVVLIVDVMVDKVVDCFVVVWLVVVWCVVWVCCVMFRVWFFSVM